MTLHLKEYAIAYLALLVFFVLLVLSFFIPSFPRESLLLGGGFCSSLMILQGFIALDRRQVMLLTEAMKREEYKVKCENRIKAIEEISFIHQIDMSSEDGLSEATNKLTLAMSRIQTYKLIDSHEDNFMYFATENSVQNSNCTITLDFIIECSMGYSPLEKYFFEHESFDKRRITTHSLTNSLSVFLSHKGQCNGGDIKSFHAGCGILILLLSTRN